MELTGEGREGANVSSAATVGIDASLNALGNDVVLDRVAKLDEEGRDGTRERQHDEGHEDERPHVAVLRLSLIHI